MKLEDALTVAPLLDSATFVGPVQVKAEAVTSNGQIKPTTINPQAVLQKRLISCDSFGRVFEFRECIVRFPHAHGSADCLDENGGESRARTTRYECESGPMRRGVPYGFARPLSTNFLILFFIGPTCAVDLQHVSYRSSSWSICPVQYCTQPPPPAPAQTGPQGASLLESISSLADLVTQTS